MFSIDEYLDEIDRLWPNPREFPTNEILNLCSEAVAAHSDSSVLWYDWGILMERCSEDHGYTAEESRQCFENSIKCDGTNAEAYQELGYVLDVYFDEFDKAEEALRKAIEHGAGCESYYARARVLAEMGKIECALGSLSENNCPFSDVPGIQELRREILDGIWGRLGAGRASKRASKASKRGRS